MRSNVSNSILRHYPSLDKLALIAKERQNKAFRQEQTCRRPIPSPPMASSRWPRPGRSRDSPAVGIGPRRRPGHCQAAPETRRLYAADWADFCRWCHAAHHSPLPADPSTLAAYLRDRAPGLGRSALARRRAAIAAAHRAAALPVPRRPDAVAGAAMRRAAQPPSSYRDTTLVRPTTARPTAVRLTQLAARCGGDLAGLRDRALLLLAAATRPARPAAGAPGPTTAPLSPPVPSRQVAAVRSTATVSQLLRLDAGGVRFGDAGLTLALQPPEDGAPGSVLHLSRGAPLEACPVRALEQWLRALDPGFGPVFRKVDRWGNVEHTSSARTPCAAFSAGVTGDRWPVTGASPACAGLSDGMGLTARKRPNRLTSVKLELLQSPCPGKTGAPSRCDREVEHRGRFALLRGSDGGAAGLAVGRMPGEANIKEAQADAAGRVTGERPLAPTQAGPHAAQDCRPAAARPVAHPRA